jgi:hypothetical protein
MAANPVPAPSASVNVALASVPPTGSGAVVTIVPSSGFLGEGYGRRAGASH